MLGVTHHAVWRFIKRWRPGWSFDEASEELRELAARAVPTRRKSIRRDARIYAVLSDLGEHIDLVVRDEAVITVLDGEWSARREPPREEEVMACEALERRAWERRLARRRRGSARNRGSPGSLGDMGDRRPRPLR